KIWGENLNVSHSTKLLSFLIAFTVVKMQLSCRLFRSAFQLHVRSTLNRPKILAPLEICVKWLAEIFANLAN
nr:hypothetical protein [bacterium]